MCSGIAPEVGFGRNNGGDHFGRHLVDALRFPEQIGLFPEIDAPPVNAVAGKEDIPVPVPGLGFGGALSAGNDLGLALALRDQFVDAFGGQAVLVHDLFGPGEDFGAFNVRDGAFVCQGTARQKAQQKPAISEYHAGSSLYL